MMDTDLTEGVTLNILTFGCTILMDFKHRKGGMNDIRLVMGEYHMVLCYGISCKLVLKILTCMHCVGVLKSLGPLLAL